MPGVRHAMRVLYQPELLPLLMDAITEGWALGRRSKPLTRVQWEEDWERPLIELRREHHLV